MTEKESGANSPDTAAALNDLAIVVRELHEDQEALQLHARAVRIRQKTLGVRTSWLLGASSLCERGSRYGRLSLRWVGVELHSGGGAVQRVAHLQGPR